MQNYTFMQLHDSLAPKKTPLLQTHIIHSLRLFSFLISYLALLLKMSHWFSFLKSACLILCDFLFFQFSENRSIHLEYRSNLAKPNQHQRNSPWTTSNRKFYRGKHKTKRLRPCKITLSYNFTILSRRKKHLYFRPILFKTSVSFPS